MPKIAICDEEQPIREYLKSLTEKCIPDSQVRLFGSGEALLRDQTSFDVILLDVSLRGEDGNQTLNGMETARKIRETSNAMIIFVTAFKEYVFEGYDVGAFHYLLKPVDEHKFAEVMQRAMWQLEREKEEMSLLIKADGSYMEVLAKNILYAENEARKIVLHTKNMPESSYTFYEKMEVLEKRLGEGFFRSHRGFLVNLREVYKYDATTIQMKNGDKVYLAKQKYNDFVTAYMKYLRSAG